MKRILSLILAVIILGAAIPVAFAFAPVCTMCGADNDFGPHDKCGTNYADGYCLTCFHCVICAQNDDCDCNYCNTNNYTAGTQVVFEAMSNESYTITVPAKLNPGQSGTVTLAGSWPSNKTISVTAEPTVTLTNSILAYDQKVLDVTFLGISEAGNNTSKQTFTETVSIEGIENALFGTWSGKFNYNVETKNVQEAPKYEMVYKPSGTTTEVKNSMRIAGHTVIPSDLAIGDSRAILRPAYDYCAEITTTSEPLWVQIEEDFYTINHGENGWVGLDNSFIGKTPKDLSDFAVKCYYLSGITYHDFALVERTVNGETILVPTMTIDHIVNGEVVGSGSRYPLWVYDSETMTFSLGTQDTTLYDGMIFYTDYTGLLWQAVTGEEWN